MNHDESQGPISNLSMQEERLGERLKEIQNAFIRKQKALADRENMMPQELWQRLINAGNDMAESIGYIRNHGKDRKMQEAWRTILEAVSTWRKGVEGE